MTTYAQIANGRIVREAPAPTAPGYGPDGAWHDYRDPAEVAAYLTEGGWTAVTEPATAKPADTATTYYVREVTVVAGVPAAAWVARPKSAEQQAADTGAANAATIRQQARDDLAKLTTARGSAVAAKGKLKTAIGSTTDGITSGTLRGLRTMTALLTVAQTKTLIGLVIDVAQADIDLANALRDTDQATKRLGRLLLGETGVVDADDTST